MWPKLSPGWFRLFLACVVVLYHTSKIIFFGYWAVFVFFVLSGFWITEMYRSRYTRYRRPVLTFCVSRILRIYPVFIATTLLGFAVYAIGLKTNAFYNISDPNWQLRSWILPTYSSFPERLLFPGWSLDIELQFYLLFPLIYLGLTGSLASRIVSLIGSVAYLLILAFAVGINNSLGVYLTFFLAGVAISWQNWQASPGLSRISQFALLLVLSALFMIPESRSSILGEGQIVLLGHNISLVVDVVLAFLTIPFVSHNVRIPDSKVSRHAGNLSFEIYLVHWVTRSVYVAYFGALAMLPRLPYFIVYLAITLVLSLAVYFLIDLPCERWRKRLIGSFPLRDAVEVR